MIIVCTYPSAVGGLIPGADTALFIVRIVGGRLPCLDPMVVNNLVATSRSNTSQDTKINNCS